MKILSGILPYAQIGLSALLIALILLQKTGAGVGGAFGGGDSFSSGFHTRRGFEKTLFRLTIAVGALFAVSAFLAFIV
ncbi:MAG: preprotein translocase subunit SecG [Patescibacteria group bacterium]|nr:preprotein translocase subunit SecG [Patescibacteria group bacterium]MDE2218265.1 preprotein translocase subunit SecG [Patescibacteria group bacterium]